MWRWGQGEIDGRVVCGVLIESHAASVVLDLAQRDGRPERRGVRRRRSEVWDMACEPLAVEQRVEQHIDVGAGVREHLPTAGHRHALIDAAHSSSIGAQVDDARGANARAKGGAGGLRQFAVAGGWWREREAQKMVSQAGLTLGREGRLVEAAGRGMMAPPRE